MREVCSPLERVARVGTGIAGCCARAASGQAAAAPPSSLTNSRRIMPNMGTSSLSSGEAGRFVCARHLSCLPVISLLLQGVAT